MRYFFSLFFHFSFPKDLKYLLNYSQSWAKSNLLYLGLAGELEFFVFWRTNFRSEGCWGWSGIPLDTMTYVPSPNRLPVNKYLCSYVNCIENYYASYDNETAKINPLGGYSDWIEVPLSITHENFQQDLTVHKELHIHFNKEFQFCFIRFN